MKFTDTTKYNKITTYEVIKYGNEFDVECKYYPMHKYTLEEVVATLDGNLSDYDIQEGRMKTNRSGVGANFIPVECGNFYTYNIATKKFEVFNPKLSFEDDYEKMVDFFNLDKDDFLESYNYLTEEEYNATKEYVDNHFGEYRADLVNRAIESLKGSMEYNGIPYEELKENADKLSITELLESVTE